ncbi:MAG: stage 0 sporulation family protein [Saprospiraceae bacterium]
MSCTSCSSEDGGKPSGCNSNGGCSTGGCNKLNTFDWLAQLDIEEPEAFDLVEVSFKNGSRKGFYFNPPQARSIIGDSVVVEAQNGYDIGRISLTGELVRLQMKKKRFSENNTVPKIIRRANDRDLEKLADARDLEHHAMVRARAIARSLKLEMKLGDVEYQGDRRKATFYYTADGRVDFRELIRHYAKEFKVKIEMRQIGARQESARIGGMGSCGRELCCSTWLTNFKSVTTGAARYQNLAINQSKLSGQCGRLKCCLNYELDTYLDALQDFPKNPDRLFTEVGTAVLIKTNVFKRSMVYVYQDATKKGKFITLSVERVKEVMEMNARKEKPMELQDSKMLALAAEEVMIDYDDVTGAIELPMEVRRRKKGRGRGGNRDRNKRRDNRDGGRDNNRGGRSDNRGKGGKDGNANRTEKGPKKEAKSGDRKPSSRKPRNQKSATPRKKPTTTNKTERKEGETPNSEKPTGNKDRRGRGNRNNRNKNRGNRNNRGRNEKDGGNKDGGGDKKE